MIHFDWVPYDSLTLDQLYKILKVRSEVFVVEQKCIYLDPDGLDQHALHLLGTDQNELVTYLRLFPPQDTQSTLKFGRVVTAGSARGKGYGKLLMDEMMTYCKKNYKDKIIECSAQLYLQAFYESYGLKALGHPYEEDGILHIHMRK